MHGNNLAGMNSVGVSTGFLANCGVRQLVEAQMDVLIRRMGISGSEPRRLLDSLVGAALNGPFHDGRRRFSAINRDGVPFQWSISTGSRRGGLRFIGDCGRPGASIAERVLFTRETLGDLSNWLPLGKALEGLDQALRYLLPRASLLDDTIMGLCVGAELARDRSIGLKVYVNSEVEDADARYRRLINCLGAFNRRAAIQQLGNLARAVGDRMIPAFTAIDLRSDGIGRLKFYFRPTEGAPALQMLAAEALGCSKAAPLLDVLHDIFLVGAAYPPEAVDVSVEFPADNSEPGFKVDLRTKDLLTSDVEVDLRIRRLLEILRAPAEDYEIMRDVVVGSLSPNRVAQILFVGVASRRDEYQVDVYFHPCPTNRGLS
jgi:hypothetical protein